MKKLFFLFVLSICSIAAWADSYDFCEWAPTGQMLNYKITPDTTVEVVSFSGWNPDGELVIPSSVTHEGITYSVTSIGEGAFSGRDVLITVSIPNSVIAIGQNAFHNCINLVTLTLSESLTSIGNSAFYGCSSLASVTLPESLSYIGESAFLGCSSLTSVTIPERMTRIEKSTFRNCTLLASVTLPESLTSIGERAFYFCSSLANVTLPKGVTVIEKNTFFACSTLASVTLPNALTDIKNQAFYGCFNLVSICIPQSVTFIGDGAFNVCANLKTVYNLSGLRIEKGATSYGNVAECATRVLSAANGDFTDHGTGSNALHKISANYTVVEEESGIETNIPRYTIPANFIYKVRGNEQDDEWNAKEVVLTDDTSAFSAPVAFTAYSVSYSRHFAEDTQGTLYLPFSAAIPDDFVVYDFVGFNGSSLYFTHHDGGIAAYTPYLVNYEYSNAPHSTLTIAATDVLFPASDGDNLHSISDNDMTFSGTIERTTMSGNKYYAYNEGLFVQSDGLTCVNPFRGYFAYEGGADPMLPLSLSVEIDEGGLVDIDAVDVSANRETRIRYSDDVYDLMGRIVRKHAQTLEGLPKGIYIWKGKKVLQFN